MRLQHPQQQEERREGFEAGRENARKGVQEGEGPQRSWEKAAYITNGRES